MLSNVKKGKKIVPQLTLKHDACGKQIKTISCKAYIMRNMFAFKVWFRCNSKAANMTVSYIWKLHLESWTFTL